MKKVIIDLRPRKVTITREALARAVRNLPEREALELLRAAYKFKEIQARVALRFMQAQIF